MKQKILQIISKPWQWIKQLWTWYKSLYQGRPWYVKTLVASSFPSSSPFFLYLGAVDMNFSVALRQVALDVNH